ncbi:MAG TPA: UDP-N-acetylmuramate dehydrogenase [Candidatus Pacearchaeota archaeon]|nr:UDP-N-acetylmuramate dehydrogenase [Candidatus Pacearchaeota archaeon]HOK94284.1 UDP-N-acetylmuramate dehydrogenase [Candidatus Pacearchaeota archaeon]HPO75439.1 UDP-N-acetylmuramate dehydrogenase [Candidatus Pacearchaeota archaeon]
MLKIQKDVSLKNYSTFKIGGKANYFTIVKDEDEIKEALQFAYKKKIPFFVLGGGSNILFSDDGFKGIVIKIQNTNYKIKDTIILAGAGIFLNQLVNIALGKELTGLEWAAGIPGEVGGAVYGNAGAFDGSIADITKLVKAFDTENFKSQIFQKEDCQFSYRNSIFKKKKKYIIIETEFQLSKGDKKEIQTKIKEHLKFRKEHHPLEYPSAGSVFKNYQITNNDLKLLEKFPDLKQFEKRGNIPAAYLISECDLKGKIIGGAQVSEKHPNFIINIANATAEDVLILISLIKQRVRDKFGIQLEEEIIYVNNNANSNR